MATIATINGTDVIATSRTDINTNFANLNSDKIETSYIDTDTTLSANSDSKIATQKATKAYVDASTGNIPATTTTLGNTKMSVAPASAASPIAVGDNDGRVPTQGENDALAGTSGTPSSTNKYVTADDVSDAAASGKIVRATGTALPALSGANLTNLPFDKYIGIGSVSNTSYRTIQYKFGYGDTATPYFGWTESGAVDPLDDACGIGNDADYIYRYLYTDMATGSAVLFSNTKKKIIEWDALIAADTSTANSVMGITASGTNGNIQGTNGVGICFCTAADGTWYTHCGTGSANTEHQFDTQSAGKHVFRIEYNSSSEVKFYVDGVLKYTATTNIPATSDPILLTFGNYTASTMLTTISAPVVLIEK